MKKHETEAGPAARQGQRIGRSSLDEVFNTVDTLKAELQITKSIAIPPGGSSLQLLAYSVRWELKDGALVRGEYEGDEMVRETRMLEGATGFYAVYFPDANSVLYRIEIGNEMIRGYIFLLGMKEA